MCNTDMFTMGLKIIVTEMFKGGTDLQIKTTINNLRELIKNAETEKSFNKEKFKYIVNRELDNYKKLKEEYNQRTKFIEYLKNDIDLQQLLEVK